MSQKKYKRGQYIVDSDFQYGVIRKIALLSVLVIVISLLFLAVIYQVYGDVEVDIAISQPLPFELMDVNVGMEDNAGLKSNLFSLLWPVLLISVGLTLVTTFLFGLILSHRLAGPVYRMRLELASIKKGNLGIPFKLREKDAFHHLAADINDLREHWRESIGELQEIYEKLDSGSTDEQSQSLKRLAGIISGFKT